jgi:tetratricopeptide (TPR) repeat protein
MRETASDDARRLFELSRRVRWRFPSSLGRPAGQPPEEAVEHLLAEREALPRAAEALLAEGDRAAATELGANAWRLWVLARDPAGGRSFLATVLADGDAQRTRERALALYGDGLLAYRLGDAAASRRLNQEALETAEASADSEALALAYLGLSRTALDDGEHERARDLAGRALELARPLDPALAQGPLHMSAQASRLCGDLDAAAALFAESLALNRRIGDEGMVGVELHNLGHVELRRGDVDTAERLFAEGSELWPSDDPYDVAMRGLNDAAIAHARGDNGRAVALLGEAEATLAEAGIEPATDDAAEIARLRAALAAP